MWSLHVVTEHLLICFATLSGLKLSGSLNIYQGKIRGKSGNFIMTIPCVDPLNIFKYNSMIMPGGIFVFIHNT